MWFFHGKSIAYNNEIGFVQKFYPWRHLAVTIKFFQKFYTCRQNDRKWSKTWNSCTNLVNGRIFRHLSKKQNRWVILPMCKGSLIPIWNILGTSFVDKNQNNLSIFCGLWLMKRILCLSLWLRWADTHVRCLSSSVSEGFRHDRIYFVREYLWIISRKSYSRNGTLILPYH